MAAKKKARASRKVKALKAKSLSTRSAKGVKGGLVKWKLTQSQIIYTDPKP